LSLNPIRALKDFNCPPHIIEHSKAVSFKALDMAFNYKDKTGSHLDIFQIETGSILHDIGRTRTHTIKHAVVGAEILRNLNFPDEIVNRNTGTPSWRLYATYIRGKNCCSC
jgi:uncharacterized protein